VRRREAQYPRVVQESDFDPVTTPAHTVNLENFDECGMFMSAQYGDEATPSLRGEKYCVL